MPNYISSQGGSISLDDPTWLKEKMLQAGAEFWNADEGVPAVVHGLERIHLAFEGKHGFALFHYNHDNDCQPSGPWIPAEIIRPVKTSFAGKPYYLPEPQFLSREMAWKVIQDFCDSAGRSARASWTPVYYGNPGWETILDCQIFGIPDWWFRQQRRDAAQKEFQANQKIVEEAALFLSKGDQVGAIRFLGPLPLKESLETQLGDMAIQNKHLEFLDWLLTNHRNRLFLKPIPGIDKTRLSLLLENNCMMGKMEVVQLLVTKFGADIHARLVTYDSQRIIDKAVFSKNVDLVRWLLDQGASPNTSPLFSCPLIHAAKYCSLEMVQLLVERGAIINPQELIGVIAPLDAAKFGGSPNIVEYLQSVGAKSIWELRGYQKPPTIKHSQPEEGTIEYHFAKNNFSANPIAKELIGTDWPVTIHLLKGEDCWLLATEGISIKPMTLSPDEDNDEVNEYVYAELFMRLPLDWPVGGEWVNQPQNRWILDRILRIARWPHEQQTGFGQSTIIANGEPPQPVSAGLPFTCWLVTTTAEEFSYWLVSEDKIVRFYWIYPLFTEERAFGRQNGTQELLRQLALNGCSITIDPKRLNIGKLALPG